MLHRALSTRPISVKAPTSFWRISMPRASRNATAAVLATGPGLPPTARDAASTLAKTNPATAGTTVRPARPRAISYLAARRLTPGKIRAASPRVIGCFPLKRAAVFATDAVGLATTRMARLLARPRCAGAPRRGARRTSDPAPDQVATWPVVPAAYRGTPRHRKVPALHPARRREAQPARMHD